MPGFSATLSSFWQDQLFHGTDQQGNNFTIQENVPQLLQLQHKFFGLYNASQALPIAGVYGFIAPNAGTILQPSDPVALDVYNLSASNVKVQIFAIFASSEEVVFDGDSFAPGYAGSSMTPLAGGIFANGNRYSILRTAGWPPEGVTVRPLLVVANDPSPN
jgi:hypothetical protein